MSDDIHARLLRVEIQQSEMKAKQDTQTDELKEMRVVVENNTKALEEFNITLKNISRALGFILKLSGFVGTIFAIIKSLPHIFN